MSCVLRRAAAVLLAAMAASVLVGCDPAPPSSVAHGVALSVTLDAQGGAQGALRLDGARVRSDAELIQLGEQLAPMLFPGSPSPKVTVESNGGGYPFVTIDATNVYVPGPLPRFDFDARPAVSFLLTAKFRAVDVVVAAPFVPVTATWTPPGTNEFGSWYWEAVTSASTAPHGSVVMAPEPWKSVLPLVLTVVSLGLVVGSLVALRRRRRWVAAGAAVVGFAVVVVIALTAGSAQTEGLGVSGWLSGPWLTAALVVPLFSLLLGVVAVGLFVAAIAMRPARPPLVFLAPPGWPAPPPGWLPPQGWVPDPSWPPAPDGWVFYAETLTEHDPTPTAR